VATIISAEKTAFLKFELENGTPRRKKVALQDISRLYRMGFQLNAEGRNAFSKLINGTMLSQGDEKVVRWCLNALARLGNREDSGRYVELSLQQNQGKPEIVAAAVAALAHLYNGNLEAVSSLKTVDPAIRTLAALQTTSPKKLDLSSFRINIDTADAEILKLALITVGLNRDVENLFDPRHSNGQIVKALCQHDDLIIRQYSVWSVIENAKLTIDDLGIHFSKIKNEPPNVQAKLLQLAAERETNILFRHSIINDGSLYEHAEAREGLARGLLTQYYQGLEEITIGWFDVEGSVEVKALLSEHFGRFSNICRTYEDKALTIAETEPAFKNRLLLGAEGKQLYGMIRAHELKNGTLDLFERSPDVGGYLAMVPIIQAQKKAMKILFLAASPSNESRLRLDREANDLRAQLALVKSPQRQIEIEHRWAVRVDQVQMELLNERPDILHFSGHGGTETLIFENTSGQSAPVSAKDLAELISLFPTIKCVLLNACYSESVGKLVAPHIDAVIGCDASIEDAAAIAFTRAFYRALAHDHNYATAFKLAKNDVSITQKRSEADKFIFISK
jgi:hypothetical protein